MPKENPKPVLPAEEIISAVSRILHTAPEYAASTDGSDTPLLALVRKMAVDGYQPNDPIREIVARLGDKWSSLCLFVLRTGTLRYETLRKIVGIISADRNISKRMLTLSLRSLESDGLITRTVISTIPPRVDYAITALGLGLMDQFDQLHGWIRIHNQEICAARQRFHAANTEH